jgi:hypothetical protein
MMIIKMMMMVLAPPLKVPAPPLAMMPAKSLKESVKPSTTQVVLASHLLKRLDRGR